MTSDPYPILESRVLSPADRRLVVLRRKNVQQLPRPRSGAAYVFNDDGQFTAVPAAYLRGDESYLVDATSVTLVDLTKGRDVEVRLTVPSIDPADDFHLIVTFSCTVVDPAAVVRQGIHDASAVLRSHLASDAGLHRVGESSAIEDVARVRRTADARVRAREEIEPVLVAGVDAQLINVQVLTPDELRKAAEEKRDLRLTHEVGSYRRGLEDHERRWDIDAQAEQRRRRIAEEDEDRERQSRIERARLQDLADHRDARGVAGLEEIALIRGERNYAEVVDGARSRQQFLEDDQREDARRRAAERRQDELRRQEHVREDERWERDARNQRDEHGINALVEMLTVFAQRGHTDTVPVDTQRIIRGLVDRVLGASPSPEQLSSGAGKDPGLPVASSGHTEEQASADAYETTHDVPEEDL